MERAARGERARSDGKTVRRAVPYGRTLYYRPRGPLLPPPRSQVNTERASVAYYQDALKVVLKELGWTNAKGPATME